MSSRGTGGGSTTTNTRYQRRDKHQGHRRGLHYNKHTISETRQTPGAPAGAPLQQTHTIRDETNSRGTGGGSTTTNTSHQRRDKLQGHRRGLHYNKHTISETRQTPGAPAGAPLQQTHAIRDETNSRGTGGGSTTTNTRHQRRDKLQGHRRGLHYNKHKPSETRQTPGAPAGAPLQQTHDIRDETNFRGEIYWYCP